VSQDVSQSPSATRAALALYARAYRGRPRAAASAPGRVNLIGEHVDYNGGPVLPVAIARRTAVVVGAGRGWEAVSQRDGVVDRFDPLGPMRGAWTDYLAGVIRALGRRGVLLSGASIAVSSNLAEGAGLSSSAALTVAAARAIAGLDGIRLADEVIAEVAWEAEHDEVGVKCGRMDQTIAALGAPAKGILFDAGKNEIQRVPFRGKLWLIDTGVRHRLTDGGYNQRRAECEEALAMLKGQGWDIPYLAAYPPARLPASLPPHLARRVAHVVTETARVRAAAESLLTTRPTDRLTALGKLMTQAHASLRDDYQASCEEADVLVEAANKLGAWGARLTGAGWGGTVVMLADDAVAPRIGVELQQQFSRIYGRVPEVWSTKASGGVKREPLGD
jgi:galactokinase